MPSLDRFFSPRSIAIIGASPDIRNLVRGRLIKALVDGEYSGKIYPVNPNHTEILGCKTFSHINKIPEPIDLALIVIKASEIPKTLAQLANCGCHQAVIYSAGFAEAGIDSKKLDEKLKSTITKYNMTILGPNGVGFFNVKKNIAATFSPGVNIENKPRVTNNDGSGLAIISQSGGIGFSIYQHAATRGIPVSYVISTGNEAGITTLDVVDFALDDKNVSCIALYTEQFREPHRLSNIAKKALSKSIPIIVVKTGKSQASKRAAISHTASLVGEDKSYEGMFNALGLIRVHDQNEILDLAAAFTSCKAPFGPRVGIISISGGGAIWLSDACNDARLEVPELSLTLQASLKEFVPSYGGTTNPVDITAQSLHSDGNIRAIELLANSNDIDMLAVVATLSEPNMLLMEKSRLLKLVKKTAKPIVFCSYTIPKISNISDLNDCGVSTFPTFIGCAQALVTLHNYNSFRIARQKDTIPNICISFPLESSKKYTEYDLTSLYKELDIQTPISLLATNENEAAKAAKNIGYPVALKLQDPNIAHKTDSGVIALDIDNEADLKQSFKKIRSVFPKNNKPILIQKMTKNGIDIILGIIKDEDFGILLMIGIGGVDVESINDVSFSPVPIGYKAAESLLNRVSTLRPLLEKTLISKIDKDALINTIIKIASFADKNRHAIKEFEINPLRVFSPGTGVIALDGYLQTVSYIEGKNV